MKFLKLHSRSGGAGILINAAHIVSVYQGHDFTKEDHSVDGTDICVSSSAGDGQGQFSGEIYYVSECFAVVSGMLERLSGD